MAFIDLPIVLLTLFIGSGVCLLLFASAGSSRGFRLGEVVLTAFLGGLILVFRACLLTRDFFDPSVGTLPAVTSALIGFSTGALLVRVLERAIGGLPEGRRPLIRPADSLRAIVVLSLLLIPIPRSTSQLNAGESRGSAVTLKDPSFVISGVYELPFMGPLDFTFVDLRRGYLTAGPETVAMFELPETPGGKFKIDVVADDLQFPRGIAVIGNTLFAAELGPLPCKNPFPMCKKSDDPSVPRIEFEKRILRESRGRVLAWDILPDGTLNNKRVLVDWLPVANSMHALNQMHVGPDNFLYLSVGHLDQLKQADEFINSLKHPGKSYLGTMLRIDPDSGEVEVFAQGLRNVYGFSFTPDGGLFGVDNDGSTRRGWRAEELVQIKRGEHYGFPFEGTFDTHTIRTALPFWILDGVSTSVSWSDSFGEADGFFVGYCGKLERVRTRTAPGGDLIKRGEGDAAGIDPLASFSGCATAMEILPGGKMILGIMFDNVLAVVEPRSLEERTAVERGAGVFRAAGCPACHSLKRGEQLVGPSLAGLRKRGVPRGREQTLEDYLRESIKYPEKYVVDGYAAVMPRQKFKKGELEDLVAYLAKL